MKVDEGYACLPGAGFGALPLKLKDIDPEDSPDIHKMSLLADVAPYSREYHTLLGHFRGQVPMSGLSKLVN